MSNTPVSVKDAPSLPIKMPDIKMPEVLHPTTGVAVAVKPVTTEGLIRLGELAPQVSFRERGLNASLLDDRCGCDGS